MEIIIDRNAGFCSGVKRVIKTAEKELAHWGSLYCLGQIVHNEEEEKRLQELGLQVIGIDEFKNLYNTKVLIRAHGEPPETYQIAKKNNIQLIDGTCPVVLRLQQKIKKTHEQGKLENAQLVIYGKKNHPEVAGLNGQTGNEAILIENLDDLEKIDFSKPISLFAQTTKSSKVYQDIINRITEKKGTMISEGNLHFTSNNSICGQVSNRDANLKAFAGEHEIVIFVGGENSSNGHYLFSVCKQENPNSKYVGAPEMLDKAWFENIKSVGVTGATSSPQWLLQSVAKRIEEISKK